MITKHKLTELKAFNVFFIQNNPIRIELVPTGLGLGTKP